MAIYHFSSNVKSRSRGQSAIACAAYRSGEKLVDDRTGQISDYTRKGGVDAAFIMRPDDSPAWAADRSQLWNEVERTERRKDAQLAREVVVALPVELTPEKREALAKDFVGETFVKQGMIADIAIHGQDTANPHAHIMLTMREVNKEGFGKKNRDWNQKEVLEEWRKEWESHANRHLREAGQDARIDHRTLAAQGIDRIPTVKMGVAANAMERKGIKTDRGDEMRSITAANQAIDKLKLEIVVPAIDQERKTTPGQIKLAWDKELESAYQGVQAQAARIQPKADAKLTQAEKKLDAHYRSEPKRPEGLLAGFREKAHKRWEAIKTGLSKRVDTLKKRSEFIVSCLNRSPISMYQSNGEKIARRRAETRQPDLKRQVDAVYRNEEKQDLQRLTDQQRGRRTMTNDANIITSREPSLEEIKTMGDKRRTERENKVIQEQTTINLRAFDQDKEKEKEKTQDGQQPKTLRQSMDERRDTERQKIIDGMKARDEASRGKSRGR